ncbi:hypothetical protein BHE74_00005453 [Ensete ventricosum]|nr:hypothetical protein BHE74_00005453 [Ensete ventricosum]
MAGVLFVPQPEGDVEVFFMCRPLFNLSARISLARRGAAATRGRLPDDDVDLFLNRPLWSGRRVPVLDEVFNLILQVTTFLRIVAMFPVKTIIPSFVTSFRA